MNGKIRFWLPSIADIVFLCPFLFLSLAGGNNLLNDADTGYHIRAGEYIIKTFTVPKYDIFSNITPPRPWVAHEWLSEVVMAFVHGFSGLTGVVLFFSFWIGVVSFLMFKFAQALRFDLVPTAAIVLLATVASALHWLARPHIFSLVLTVAWYGILNNYQYWGKDRLYLLPLLMLLWVNLHGAFIIGFVFLGVYFVGNLPALILGEETERIAGREKCKKLAIIAAFALLASMINPWGYSILFFPFTTISNSFVINDFVEYLSPNFHESLPYKYLLLLTLGVVAVSKKRLDSIELMLLLLFTYMSLYSTRNIPLFAIAVTPILLRQIQALLAQSESRAAKYLRKRSKNLAVVDASARGHLWPVIAIAGVAALALSGKIAFTFDPAKKPVAAVKFLQREKLSDRMFNDDEFGDYLIYAAWPEYRVSFDGRADMYGNTLGKEYAAVLRVQPDWENIIEKNHVGWIFCGAGTPLAIVVAESQNWRRIYADQVAEIFVKDIPKNRPLIEKYSTGKSAKTIEIKANHDY